MKKTVGAIIEKNRRILLTKRNVEPFKGLWCLPGGHIEPGENAEDAFTGNVKKDNIEVRETGWFKPKEIKNMEFAFNHKKILEKYFEKNG